MYDPTPILMILLMITIVIGSLAWTHYRAMILLRNWATENGYQLLQHEARYLRTGPYFWRRSRNQLVYYVTVLDPQGWRRSAYLRLGNWFFGMLGNQVDVTWDG